ncbi:MAG: DNA gyrase subunit A [Alphaproteobacteria bacterium]|nr:DNA gyrase subunit A [Alphaproteobacteria bacterium]
MTESQDQNSLPSDILPVTIEEEMRRSYLDYAMSVIVSRALPDVRDGLKPVHRRILYAMKEGGYDSSKPYKKSARIVGDVMGKYHPHGDSAIYDAMVRMAQDFSMRLPLVDGQGNFGSMDGDPPAAMRYTEARLAKSAETLLEDIDKDTVNFQPNYDEITVEPVVLPARFPNLLVNGAGGIAVGMATNIPSHNLVEVCNACIVTIDNPDITIEELLEIVPGPDFPTGGLILGHTGCRAAAHTGRGSIIMRARTSIEEVRKDRQAIVVTEIPYQQNKKRLIEIIAETVQSKTVEGISDLRDESDRDGVRIVIELKRDAVPDVVLNQLFKHTPLQTSFGVNMLALYKGRPEQMTLRAVIKAFLEFREEVITRRTVFELGQARARAHILVGLAVAVANIDEVIALIRKAADPAIAKQQLLERNWPAEDIAPLIALVDEDGLSETKTYRMSETQAKAILDLRLHRLTGLERDKIGNDLRAVVDQISDYLDILANRSRVLTIMKDEITEVRDRFGNPRRTSIETQEFEEDIEDLIQREDMVVTVSMSGYIKRVPLSAYRAQRRGGKGKSGMSTKDEDFVTEIFVASTHTPMLFFSSMGKAYKLKVYKLPLSTPQARGKALVNLLPMELGETITASLALPEDEATWTELDAMFATAAGTVRRNKLSDFANVRSNGIIAMKLDEGDRLIAVRACTPANDVLLATRNGKAIRFAVDDVRVFASRASTGVRGVRLLAQDDAVMSMSILTHVETTVEERAAYLKQSRALRASAGEEVLVEQGSDEEEETTTEITLSPERFAELAAKEEFLLAISDKGFGKRSSSYEYRISNRGGLGIVNMKLADKTGSIVATFPVTEKQEVMMVTDGGQIIRMPIHDVRITGRSSSGVILFRVGEGEKVVSVAALEVDETAEDGAEEGIEIEVTEAVEQAPEVPDNA